jgi:serine O-acetyltransferase
MRHGRRVTWLLTLWAWPLWRAVQGSAARPYTDRDVERWADCLGRPQLRALPRPAAFARLVAGHPEFRSLVHFRLTPLPGPLRLLLRALYRPLPTLHLNCALIGPGLFIEHGFATTLTAALVGADCTVNQQVTVGHTGRGQPVIGDRVRLCAGAVVVGPVTVGDDATIGANATVVRDVPAGAVMLAPVAVARPRASS